MQLQIYRKVELANTSCCLTAYTCSFCIRLTFQMLGRNTFKWKIASSCDCLHWFESFSAVMLPRHQRNLLIFSIRCLTSNNLDAFHTLVGLITVQVVKSESLPSEMIFQKIAHGIDSLDFKLFCNHQTLEFASQSAFDLNEIQQRSANVIESNLSHRTFSLGTKKPRSWNLVERKEKF